MKVKLLVARCGSSFSQQPGQVIEVGDEEGARLIDAGQAEAVVASGLRKLKVGIDGITQDVYATYRRKGKLDQVLANVERIARARAAAGSKSPASGLSISRKKLENISALSPPSSRPSSSSACSSPERKVTCVSWKSFAAAEAGLRLASCTRSRWESAWRAAQGYGLSQLAPWRAAARQPRRYSWGRTR